MFYFSFRICKYDQLIVAEYEEVLQTSKISVPLPISLKKSIKRRSKTKLSSSYFKLSFQYIMHSFFQEKMFNLSQHYKEKCIKIEVLDSKLNFTFDSHFFDPNYQTLKYKLLLFQRFVGFSITIVYTKLCLGYSTSRNILCQSEHPRKLP